MDYKYKNLEKYLSNDPSYLNEVEGKYSIEDMLGQRKKQEIIESFCKDIQKSYDFALNDVNSFFKKSNDINEMKQELKKKIDEVFESVSIKDIKVGDSVLVKKHNSAGVVSQLYGNDILVHVAKLNKVVPLKLKDIEILPNIK
jgi:hypothetical protein